MPDTRHDGTRKSDAAKQLRGLPSVDALMGWPAMAALGETYGRSLVTACARAVLDQARAEIADGATAPAREDLAARIEGQALSRTATSLRPVFNLTGTVIHTNLGRAPLPSEAVEAMAAVASRPSNLEFDLSGGRRGDRDAHLEDRICRLTGAEAATVVNNNAAAVLLLLNTLANRKEVLVSRGELVEIGGSFRIPDVMKRAGARLHEVGTTNRTHERDFAEAICTRTAAIMKVHTSNYEVRGFIKTVPEARLADIAHAAGIPFVVDLGSGVLVDLSRYGLPHEPTVRECLSGGADLVTFSGDKLLGGPQAGIIAGRADLVARIRRNPMKRALRLDKIMIAALDATLALYEMPEQLAARLPVLRLLTRTQAEIEAQAGRLAPKLAERVRAVASVSVEPVYSQIGSGALPVETLPSAALVLTPTAPARRRGRAATAMAAAFRELPQPVIGRIAGNRLFFDLRCLDDEPAFLEQIELLSLPGEAGAA